MNLAQTLVELGRMHMENLELRAQLEEAHEALRRVGTVSESESAPPAPEGTSPDESPAADG